MWKLGFVFNTEGESYTDCQTMISIGWNAKWVLSVIENRVQWLAAIKGLIEHEAAHVKFSSNEGREAFFIRCRKVGIPFGLAQFVENVVEDGRVNRCHVNDDLKALKSVRWVCEVHYRYESQQPVSDGLEDNVLRSFIQRSRCGKDLPNIPQDAKNILDSFQALLDRGIWANSSVEMRDVSAFPICEALMDALSIRHSTPTPSLGMNNGDKEQELNGKGQEIPEGNVDPRVGKTRRSSQKLSQSKPKEKQSEQLSQPKESSKSVQEEQETVTQVEPDEAQNKESQEPKTTGESVDSEEKCGSSSGDYSEKEESAAGEESSKQDPEKGELEENETDNATEQLQSDTQSGEDESNQELDSDESEQEPSGGELGSGFDSQPNLKDEAEGTDPEEESEPFEDYTPSDEFDLDIPDEEEFDEDSFEDTEGFGGLSLGESDPSDGSQEPESCQISEVEPGVGVGGDDEFHDLFAECGEELEDIDREDEEVLEKSKQDAEAILQSAKVEAKAVSTGIHENVIFVEQAAEPNSKYYEKVYHAVEELIEEWVDLVKARIERKRNSPNNGRISGYLDQKRAYQAVAFLNNRIFRQPVEFSDKGDMAVYNLIDCSGSMDSRDKWIYAVMASTCLVNALESLNVPHTVTTYCDRGYSVPEVWHTRLVGWEQEDKTGLGGFMTEGSNRDGYSIRVAVEELKKRQEKVKVLIQECDGLPASNDYRCDSIKDAGIQDTADAVQEARDAGIKVICLYFGDTDKDSLAKAKYMYGDGLVVVRNIKELVYDLVEVMDEELKRAF